MTIIQQRQQHPFNGPLSRTTLVSQYQKSKITLGLMEKETVSGSGFSWTMFKSAPRPGQITTLPFSFFQAGCPSCNATNSVKALKAMLFLYFKLTNLSAGRHVLCCRSSFLYNVLCWFGDLWDVALYRFCIICYVFFKLNMIDLGNLHFVFGRL